MHTRKTISIKNQDTQGDKAITGLVNSFKLKKEPNCLVYGQQQRTQLELCLTLFICQV